MALRRKESTAITRRTPCGEVTSPSGRAVALLTQVTPAPGGPKIELQVESGWLRAEECLSLARQLIECVEKGVVR